MRARPVTQDPELGLKFPATASNRKLRTRSPIKAGGRDKSAILAAALLSVENRRNKSRKEEADPGYLTRQVE